MAEKEAKNDRGKEFGINNYCLEQQKTEKDVFDFVEASFKVAKDVAREAVHDEIAYCRKFLRTRHGKDYWGQGDDEETYNEKELQNTRRFRSSLTKAKIRQIARKQTKNDPKIYIKVGIINQESPEVQEKLRAFGGPQGYADTLQYLYDETWERQNFRKTIYKLCEQGHQEGTAITASYWDNEANHRNGDVAWVLVRPENFCPEPGNEEIETCTYIYNIRIIDLRRGVEEFGDKIFKVIEQYNENLDKELKISELDGEVAMRTKVVVVESLWKDKTCDYYSATGEKITEKQYDILMEAFEASVEADPGGDYSEVEPTKIVKYPYGRMITFSGSEILRDEPNNELGFNPFDKYTPNPVAFSFWGEPTTRDLSVIQENYDKIIQAAITNLFVYGMPKGFFKEGEIDPKEFRESAGQYFDMKTTGRVQDNMYVTNGAPISQDAFRISGILYNLNEDLSGVHQAAEGKAGGAQSGRMTIALQEQTREFLTQPTRDLESVIKSAAMKHITLLTKYAKKGREYSYKNEKGERQLAKLPMSLDEIECTIDLVVSSGSMLPEDRESRSNRALLLNQRDPVYFNTNWLTKELGYENDAELNSGANQYEMLKRATMQALEMSGNDPAKLQQMIQDKVIHPEMAQLLIQQLKQQAEANQGVEGNAPRQS